MRPARFDNIGPDRLPAAWTSSPLATSLNPQDNVCQQPSPPPCQTNRDKRVPLNRMWPPTWPAFDCVRLRSALAATTACAQVGADVASSGARRARLRLEEAHCADPTALMWKAYSSLPTMGFATWPDPYDSRATLAGINRAKSFCH